MTEEARALLVAALVVNAGVAATVARVGRRWEHVLFASVLAWVSGLAATVALLGGPAGVALWVCASAAALRR